MTHDLKILPDYFKELASGTKCFELRYNDRNYLTGDELLLNEYDPEYRCYTNRVIRAKVVYVLGKFDGLKDGYVIMGLEIVTIQL